MSRYRAAAIHFALSAVIFVGLAYLVVFVWYPGFFFETDGGWQGMRILIGVDLVLGPLLTLIVFKAGKPGLKSDLAMIGTFQALCLVAGVWIVHSERPIAMVYVDGSFFSVTRDDFLDAGIAPPDFDSFPGKNPKWVMVALPEDPIAQSDVRGRMLKAGKPLRLATDLYRPFAPDEAFRREAYDPADLESRDLDGQALAQWLASQGGTIDDYRFHLYGARYTYAYLGFRKADDQFVGLLDIDAPYSNDVFEPKHAAR